MHFYCILNAGQRKLLAAPTMSGKKSIHSARAGRANSTGKTLSHLDAKGQLRTVEVGAKPITHREAIARGARCGTYRRHHGGEKNLGANSALPSDPAQLDRNRLHAEPSAIDARDRIARHH